MATAGTQQPEELCMLLFCSIKVTSREGEQSNENMTREGGGGKLDVW